jgi:hypothetical protein
MLVVIRQGQKWQPGHCSFELSDSIARRCIPEEAFQPGVRQELHGHGAQLRRFPRREDVLDERLSAGGIRLKGVPAFVRQNMDVEVTPAKLAGNER